MLIFASASAARATRCERPGRRLWRRKPHVRRQQVPRPHASSDDFDPFKFWSSEQVQQEADVLEKRAREIFNLFPSYPLFDLAGKEMFIKQAEDYVERIQISRTRMQLAKDPTLQLQNMQLQEASVSQDILTERYRALLNTMREIAERSGESRIQWSGGSTRTIGLGYHVVDKEWVDPEVAQAMMDPQLFVAICECNQDPSKINNYTNRPHLNKFLCKVVKTKG